MDGTRPTDPIIGAGGVRECAACFSRDGVWGRLILVLGWVSADVPAGPYVEQGCCWLCGARAYYVVRVCQPPAGDAGRPN